MIFTDDEGAPRPGCSLIPLVFVVQFVFNLALMLTLSPLCMLYPDIHRVVRAFSRSTATCPR